MRLDVNRERRHPSPFILLLAEMMIAMRVLQPFLHWVLVLMGSIVTLLTAVISTITLVIV